MEKYSTDAEAACTVNTGCLRLQKYTFGVRKRIAFLLQQWLYRRASILRYKMLSVFFKLRQIT